MPPELRVRSLQPGDAERVQEFVRRLSAHARTERYFAPIRELSARQLERVTRAGDARDVALGVLAGEQLIAMAECSDAEFAVVVGDAWQGLGIGAALMLAIVRHAEDQGLRSLHGVVRMRNRPMLRLAGRLGFRIMREEEPGLVRVERMLLATGIAIKEAPDGRHSQDAGPRGSEDRPERHLRHLFRPAQPVDRHG